MSKALEDIAAERKRQIENEGWSTEHDDEHDEGDLARAAACYIDPRWDPADIDGPPLRWPWEPRWWKPKDRRRNLVRAGALIVAEIDRLDRNAPPTVEELGEGLRELCKMVEAIPGDRTNIPAYMHAWRLVKRYLSNKY